MKWTSHRGLCVDCVENTRGSFKRAIEAGFYGLETDLRCTQDGVIVLHHDRSMDRTAGLAKNIDEMVFEEFSSVVLTDNQKGLSFLEFIEEFAAFHWIFDVKPETATQVIEALKGWCQKTGAESWLLSHSRFLLWSERHECYLKRLFPKATTLAREAECQRAGISLLLGLGKVAGIKKGRIYALPPQFLGLKLFKKSFIEKYQRRGAKVLAYLPEHDGEVAAAMRAGVDEILTNGKPCNLNISS